MKLKLTSPASKTKLERIVLTNNCNFIHYCGYCPLGHDSHHGWVYCNGMSRSDHTNHSQHLYKILFGESALFALLLKKEYTK